MSHMPRPPRFTPSGDPVYDTAQVLTNKQRQLVANKLAGMPTQQAAIEAGYSVGTAKTEAYVYLTQPHMQAHMRACLEASGLDTLRQAQILSEAAQTANTMIVDKNGDEHFNADHRTRIEAVRIAMTGSGTIGPRMADAAGGVTVNITIDNRALPPQDVIDITPDDAIRT